MSASETALANRALQKLGATRIALISEDTRNARAMNTAFASVRQAELRKHVWRFATTRSQLTKDVTAPTFGYSNRFALPAGFLRLVQVGDYDGALQAGNYRDAPTPLYQVEGTWLLTSLSSPLNVRWVQDVTDTTKFDPLFDDVMAVRLAFECCEEIAQSDTKKQALAREYRDIVDLAMSIDAVEKASEAIVDDSWVLGRL